MSKRAPKSPWQKYGKKRFPYSAQYQAWRRAVADYGACDQRTVKAACDHSRAFRVAKEGC